MFLPLEEKEEEMAETLGGGQERTFDRFLRLLLIAAPEDEDKVPSVAVTIADLCKLFIIFNQNYQINYSNIIIIVVIIAMIIRLVWSSFDKQSGVTDLWRDLKIFAIAKLLSAIRQI